VRGCCGGEVGRDARYFDIATTDGNISHDAIGTVHRGWDEKRMRLRSLARVGQLAKGAAASPASQRTEIGQ
jgi:hypothetical protein